MPRKIFKSFRKEGKGQTKTVNRRKGNYLSTDICYYPVVGVFKMENCFPWHY